MAFCTNCGSKIDDEARFCPDCGAPVVPGAPKAEPWEEEKKDFGTKINELNNTPDTTSEFDQNDIQSNKVMAVLAYLGILVLVPLFAARESRYARFHTNQGLVLAIAQFAWTFVSRIIVSAVGAVNETVSLIIGGVCSLVNIAFAVFTVIGIINAAKGVNIVSVALDAPLETISSLAEKLGAVPGLSVTTAYSSVVSEE